MCLDYYGLKTDTEDLTSKIGYKIFTYSWVNGRVRLNGWLRDCDLKINKWNVVKNDLKLSTHGMVSTKYYESGFHCFDRLVDARKIFLSEDDNVVILKVHGKDITATGQQFNSDAFVAKRLFIYPTLYHIMTSSYQGYRKETMVKIKNYFRKWAE